MTCRVVITESIHEAAVERLRQHADVVVLSRFYGAPDLAAERLAGELSQADLAIVRAARIGKEAIHSASRLRAIIVHGAGVDKIDVRTAAECAVRIITTPGANAEAVAEFTLSLIFCLAKGLVNGDRRTRAGQFLDAKNDIGRTNVELSGKTLGVVGLGQVGQRVCSKARALGLRVLAYSGHATAAEVDALGAANVETLQALLEASDFVSLHCALDDLTRHLIGTRELQSMKPSAFLVNTARGAIVDQPALVACLKEGRIAGAGLDVYECEPPDIRDELLALPNVVLTPHVAGLTAESSYRLGMRCVDEALRVMNAAHDDPADTAEGRRRREP
jgi:D-3-phosphoglycerate dehydrogenase